jgi:hypothetical protein
MFTQGRGFFCTHPLNQRGTARNFIANNIDICQPEKSKTDEEAGWKMRRLL